MCCGKVEAIKRESKKKQNNRNRKNRGNEREKMRSARVTQWNHTRYTITGRKAGEREFQLASERASWRVRSPERSPRPILTGGNQLREDPPALTGHFLCGNRWESRRSSSLYLDALITFCFFFSRAPFCFDVYRLLFYFILAVRSI